MHRLEIRPGWRARAQHEHHETAICVMSGAAVLYSGEGLA